MADTQVVCNAADVASGKAKCPDTHDIAARAHRKAASALYASGRPDEAKAHTKKAQAHAAKGSKPSGSTGLAAWTKSKRK